MNDSVEFFDDGLDIADSLIVQTPERSSKLETIANHILRRWYFFCPYFLQKLIWIPTRFTLSFFGRLEISGLENLEKLKKPVIFACNHTSELDPFFIPASLSLFSRFSPIFYTARERKFYTDSGWRKHFYGGFFFQMWGAYQVYAGLQNYEKAMSNQVSILQDDGDLCVYPEGGKTHDGSIQEARGGVGYLAHMTRVPVVPVFIGGVFKLNFWEFFRRKRKFIIRFGSPLLFRDHIGKSYPEIHDFKLFATKVMNEVAQMAVSSEA